MMRMIAQSLSPGCTTAALLRRKEIAHALPDMSSRPQVAKEPGEKIGKAK